MSKTNRYLEFDTLPNIYKYAYQEADIDLELDVSKPVIIEVGCGSGAYTIELAKQHPNTQYIGIDRKSDRLHFGAKYCIENNIANTKRLCSSIDHITHCFKPDSIDEIRITFPDPRPGRDRQKLTSPKYQTIYKLLLKPGGILHLKTDDKDFFDYSTKSLQEGGFMIGKYIEDIYSNTEQRESSIPELKIKTYYEMQWLAQGRKVYYLEYRTTSTTHAQ